MPSSITPQEIIMDLTEVTTLRLPKGTIPKLRQLAHRRSVEQQADISWTMIVRGLIADLLAANESVEGR